MRNGEWLRGGGFVRVIGADVPRFLERCRKNDIALRDVLMENELTVRFLLSRRDLAAVRQLASGCGCDLEVLSDFGLPDRLRALRRRWWLAAAALFIVSGLVASSLFVWSISVTENDSDLSDETILHVLSEQGVKVGSFYPAYRSERIRTLALRALPELSWLAVNVRGCRASVQVRAAVPPPEIFDPRTPGDVIAGESGVVTELRVFAGEAASDRGQAVKAGDVLIRGGAIHARGEVLGLTWREIAAAAPLSAGENPPSGGEKHRFSLLLGQKRINFYHNSGILPGSCDKIITVWRPGPDWLPPVPVALVRETLRPWTGETVTRSPSELRLELEQRIRQELQSRLGENGKINAIRFTAAESGGWLIVTGRAECEERLDRDAAKENIP